MMLSYEVFDELFREFRKRFDEPNNFIFVQKYAVGQQMIRVCTLNSVKFSVRAALDFLDTLQKKIRISESVGSFFSGCCEI